MRCQIVFFLAGRSVFNKASGSERVGESVTSTPEHERKKEKKIACLPGPRIERPQAQTGYLHGLGTRTREQGNSLAKTDISSGRGSQSDRVDSENLHSFLNLRWLISSILSSRSDLPSQTYHQHPYMYQHRVSLTLSSFFTLLNSLCSPCFFFLFPLQ